MSDEMLNVLEQINLSANRLVGSISDDQWGASTPCSEWTVRDLVNHMAGTTKLFGASAGRLPFEPPTDGDNLGSDPVAAFAGATESSAAAWHSEGALEGMVTLPQEMPAVACLGVNIIDIGTHCWDLATAIGAEHGLTDETVAVIDQWNRQIVSDEVRSRGGFGSIIDAGDADGMPAMLAFVGRRG